MGVVSNDPLPGWKDLYPCSHRLFIPNCAVDLIIQRKRSLTRILRFRFSELCAIEDRSHRCTECDAHRQALTHVSRGGSVRCTDGNAKSNTDSSPVSRSTTESFVGRDLFFSTHFQSFVLSRNCFPVFPESLSVIRSPIMNIGNFPEQLSEKSQILCREQLQSPGHGQR